MQGGLIVISERCPRDSAPTGLKVTAVVNLLTEVALIILDCLLLTVLFLKLENVISHPCSLISVQNKMYVCTQ